jgi:hypothetical protein
MKTLATALSLGLLTLGANAAHAQSQLQLTISAFSVNWDVPVYTPNFGYVAHYVTATGQANWNTQNRVSYADLYGQYHPNSPVNLLKNSISLQPVHNIDLTGLYDVRWRTFRFRLTLWEHGGALEAALTAAIIHPSIP